MNSVKKIFGRALKELRDSKNLTQEQLAECLNLQTYQTINRIENGKSFVTSTLLETMCDFFNVAPSFFFLEHPEILQKEHLEYSREIKQLLPSLPLNRLKDIYEIIQVFKK